MTSEKQPELVVQQAFATIMPCSVCAAWERLATMQRASLVDAIQRGDKLARELADTAMGQFQRGARLEQMRLEKMGDAIAAAARPGTARGVSAVAGAEQLSEDDRRYLHDYLAATMGRTRTVRRADQGSGADETEAAVDGLLGDFGSDGTGSGG